MESGVKARTSRNLREELIKVHLEESAAEQTGRTIDAEAAYWLILVNYPRETRQKISEATR